MVAVTIPYAPRSAQVSIHDGLDAHRFGVVVAHRRMGKTVMAVNHLVRAAIQSKKLRPRFGYIGPTYRQAKAIAWDYLKFYTEPIPGRVYNETELRVDLPNGAQVRLYGSDNPDSLRGIYLDGVVLDEFGLMASNVFSEVIRPALSDRSGWAVFIGTPNGRNQFWEIAEKARTDTDWFYAAHSAETTGILPESELIDARKMMSADEYAQEYSCSFEASVKGAIYADELMIARTDNRITRVPYDPILLVNTAWDLGVGDATAIWFYQAVGAEVRVIDYYEASGEGLPYYVSILKSRGYNYGEHAAPFDIQVKEFSSGRSRIEVAQSLGVNFRIAPQLGLEDGIHAVRMLLPRCWFDHDKCRTGLDALQNYQRDYNQRMNEYKATPVHNWASHAADAMRYLAVSFAEPMKSRPIIYPEMGYV